MPQPLSRPYIVKRQDPQTSEAQYYAGNGTWVSSASDAVGLPFPVAFKIQKDQGTVFNPIMISSPDKEVAHGIL